MISATNSHVETDPCVKGGFPLSETFFARTSRTKKTIEIMNSESSGGNPLLVTASLSAVQLNGYVFPFAKSACIKRNKLCSDRSFFFL